MTGVRWRVDLSDHPPVVGDLLVRNLGEGDDPGPGWTVVAGSAATGERVAWKVAEPGDTTVTGVWVVAPRDLTAGTAARTVGPDVGGAVPLRDLAAWVPADAPALEVANGQPFTCPHCGQGGRRAGSSPGLVRFTPPADHPIAASYPAADGQPATVVLLCLADPAAGRRAWQVAFPD